MSEGKQQDFYGECNDLRVSPDQFAAQFCSRCLQPECVRSQFGKSLFETRVHTWEERLILNPAQLDSADPRFKEIQGKKFLDIYTGPIPEIGRGGGAWLDPRDLEETSNKGEKPLPSAVSGGSSPAPAPVSVQPVLPASTPKTPEPVIAPGPVQPSTTPAKNTPFRQGAMVGDNRAPSKAPAPVYDPWAGPKQPSPPDDATVVLPGARIKLGG